MLLVVLLVLAILTERGSIALEATVTDLTQTSIERTTKQSFFHAEAGIEEAKGRLIGKPSSNPNFIGDPAASPNPLWSAYILTSSSWTPAQDPDYNDAYTNYFPTVSSQTNTTKVVNGLQTAIPYWIKIRHKREYDAELEGHTPAAPHYIDNDGSTATHTAANPGNIIYYGYHPADPGTPTEFTTATATIYQPVELVRAYGSGSGTSKSIEVELVHNANKVGAPIQAPLYGKGNTTFHDNTTSVSGNDDCGVSAKPPMFVKSPATIFGSPLYLGSPASPQYGPMDLNISSLINSLKAGATVLTSDQDDPVFGSSTNYVTVYSNTSDPFNINGLLFDDAVGYGTLLVEGDLRLQEDVTWKGLILVSGRLEYAGTLNQPVRIRGGVIANQSDDLQGHVDIRYDSCQIAKALADKPLQVRKWKERS